MMGGGAGSSQSVFGSSGGADFFTKFTSGAAAIFMITSIFPDDRERAESATRFSPRRRQRPAGRDGGSRPGARPDTATSAASEDG